MLLSPRITADTRKVTGGCQVEVKIVWGKVKNSGGVVIWCMGERSNQVSVEAGLNNYKDI